MNIAEQIVTIEQNTVKMGEMIDRLEALTITGEASGENININDSAEMHFKGLSAFGKTKQLKSTGKNMIPFPYFDGMRKETNGITFVANDDGSITVKGSATGKAQFRLLQDYSYKVLPLKVGSYSVSSGIEEKASGYNISIQIRSSASDTSTYLQSDYNSRTITITSDTWIPTIDLAISSGVTTPIEGVTIYPMLEKGTTPTKYEPYTNGIPSPSPELPQPMNSAGKDGSIDVEISNGDGSKIQSLSVNTPYGLPGVPVYPMDSGDPYIGFLHHEDAIDIDGQERICDEVDFTKGVYIQRVGEYTIDIDRVIDVGDSYAAICKAPEFALSPYPGGMWELGGYINDDSSLNDAFDISGIDENEEKVEPFVVLTSFDENIYSQLTKEEFKARYNGSKMLLIRAEAIETPLSTEHEKLHTYKPTTNISNDGGAHLSVKYYVDPELR